MEKSNNSATNAPSKPETVPANAVWVEADNEWELGEKSSDGKNIGEWKWFLAPIGYLVCHSFFNEEGELESFTRFHPDGTYSQKGEYKNGKQHGTAYYQASENDTAETPIPHQAPDNVFSMIYEWNEGNVLSAKLFTIDGDELDQHGNLLAPTAKENTPTDAEWNDESEEWEKGEYNDADKDGTWTGWNTKGEKCSETIYDKGKYVEYNRFHPDGTASTCEKYSPHNLTTYKMICKSHAPSNEHFPEGGVGEDVFKLEYFYDNHGYMTSWKSTDENGKVLEDNPLYSNLECRVEQTKFDSLNEASQVWNEKGTEYYKELNWWLSQYYETDHDVPEDADEPVDERDDMERVVLEALEKLNKEGNATKARELFHPSYEPISKYTWGRLGKNIGSVVALDQDTVLARVANDGVYVLKNDTITLKEGVLCMGSSKNKDFVAFGYKDRIEVSKGLDGSKTATFAYPKKYNEELYKTNPTLNSDVFNDPSFLNIKEIKVSSDGKKALLVSGEGIYWLNEKEAIQVYPHLDKLEEMVDGFKDRLDGEDLGDFVFDLSLTYPNADFSMDDQYIVASGMIPSPIHAGTCIYKNVNGTFELVKYGQQDSMFGIQNQFHPNGNDMLHSACLYASINTNWSDSMENTSFRLSMDSINNGSLELDNFDGGYTQSPGMVLSACPIEDGFALGQNGGYVWWYSADAELNGYVSIGGHVTAMDITPDKQFLIVATNQGRVVKFKFIKERGTGMITNMKLKDEKWYLFLKTFEPMIW